MKKIFPIVILLLVLAGCQQAPDIVMYQISPSDPYGWVVKFADGEPVNLTLQGSLGVVFTEVLPGPLSVELGVYPRGEPARRSTLPRNWVTIDYRGTAQNPRLWVLGGGKGNGERPLTVSVDDDVYRGVAAMCVAVDSGILLPPFGQEF